MSAKKSAVSKDIVMTGWAGLRGSCIMARLCREKLEKKLPRFIMDEACALDESNGAGMAMAWETAQEYGAKAYPAGYGGVYKALRDMSDAEGTGISVYLEEIAIRQETIEICECLGANPYMLYSGGCLIIVSDRGSVLARILREKHIKAGVIGYTRDGNDKVVISGERRIYIPVRIEDEMARIAT